MMDLMNYYSICSTVTFVNKNILHQSKVTSCSINNYTFVKNNNTLLHAVIILIILNTFHIQ